MATKPAEFKPPKTLAACADQLYNTQQQRYALQKQVEELSKQETILREHLINNLPKSDATGVAGKVARATVKSRDVYVVKDWDKLYGYITLNAKKNPGVWSLLQRRLGEGAAAEIISAGKKLPGVEAGTVPVISLNKV